MTPAKLYINHMAEYDWLIALEFGCVDDAQPPDNWRGVSDHFGYLYDAPGGRPLGFKVIGFSEFDAESPNVEEIWGEPLFDVPLLGLTAVPAGEVVLATRALLGEEATINRAYFSEAVGTEDPEEALPIWLACLESGDSMAHFALGYTLFELGRFSEAYRHLRHYTEIAPHGSWNWCWLGKGAEAVSEKQEAIAAYERALELEADGDEETDATERLREMVGFEGMVRIRERLNEKTDGRVGLYSTAEHYSNGPAAKVIYSHQYDEDSPVECPACGWAGPAKDGDLNSFEELFDVCCPSCDKMLLVVNYATPDAEGKSQPMPARPAWEPGARFSEALTYAVETHASQRRKGSDTPYIAHLLGVCGLVIEDGGSEDEAIAGLLHDAAEDQGGEATLEEIGGRFGPDVRRIVAACSDTFEMPKPPWEKRKADYIAGIALKQDDEVRVSLADKVHNARSILFDYRAVGESVFDRFRVNREKTLGYYRALAGAFAERAPGPLADELTRVVDELERAVV